MKRKPIARYVAAALCLSLVHGAAAPGAWAAAVIGESAARPTAAGVAVAPVSLSLSNVGPIDAVGTPIGGSFVAAPMNAPTREASVPISAAEAMPFDAALSVPSAAPAVNSADAVAVTAAATATSAAPAAPTNTVRRRFAELAAYFGIRRAETANDSVSLSATAENPTATTPLTAATLAAPAKPATPPVPAPESGSTSAQRSIYWFLGGSLVAQVGIEILGLAMPLLMRSKFGGFGALVHIGIYSSIAGAIGRFVGGSISAKFGEKKVFLAATALRLVSISAMVVFLFGPAAFVVAATHGPITGAILTALAAPLAKLAALLAPYAPLTVLTVFYSFNGFMAGISATTGTSIPTILLGSDRATMEKFSSLQQWLLETIGVTGPKLGGGIVQAFGFTVAIAVYPVLLSVAMLMFFFGVKMPDGNPATPNAKNDRPGFFGRLFARLAAAMAPMNKAIGRFLIPLRDRVVRFVDGLVEKAYLGKWIKERGGKGNLSDADEAALLSRSTFLWTMAAVLSLPAFLTFLLPYTLPAYAAMIVFGVTEVIATQKLYALLISRTKGRGEVLKVNAVAGAISTLVATAALNAAGLLFDKFTGFAPLMWFSAALVPLGAAVFFLRRTLTNLDKNPPAETGARPTGGFGLLWKDPVMRWAFAAYVLLVLTNPLLYQILSQAYALLIVGGSATAASGVASWITALYSFGGLLGAVYMWRESTLISAAKKQTPPPAEAPATAVGLTEPIPPAAPNLPTATPRANQGERRLQSLSYGL